MVIIEKNIRTQNKKGSKRKYLLDGLLQIKSIFHTTIQERPCITKICKKMSSNWVKCYLWYAFIMALKKSVFIDIAQCKNSERVHTTWKIPSHPHIYIYIYIYNSPDIHFREKRRFGGGGVNFAYLGIGSFLHHHCFGYPQFDQGGQAL